MSQNPAEPPAPPAVAIEALPEPLPDPRDALIGTDVSDAAIAEEEAREIEPQNSGRFALHEA